MNDYEINESMNHEINELLALDNFGHKKRKRDYLYFN